MRAMEEPKMPVSPGMDDDLRVKLPPAPSERAEALAYFQRVGPMTVTLEHIANVIRAGLVQGVTDEWREAAIATLDAERLRQHTGAEAEPMSVAAVLDARKQPNWDGDGAAAVTPEAEKWALEAARTLRQTPETSVGYDGSVLMCWSIAPLHVHVYIAPNGAVTIGGEITADELSAQAQPTDSREPEACRVCGHEAKRHSPATGLCCAGTDAACGCDAWRT